ncbi:MAG: universal stress protein [Anaerolineales bacterium]|nr:universal stress protein [Anaerolineales bacterium]
MIDHILVPLDGSALAEYVLPHVKSIAPVMNARVTLLHVMEHPRSRDETLIVDPVNWHLRKHKLETYLEKITQRLKSAGLNVDHTILEGNPAESIIEFAHNNNVGLIAITTHGSSGPSRWNISSVVQKILLLSYKSILLVRAYRPKGDSAGVRYKRIFAGLDCSMRSEFILPVAITLAQSYKSKLLLGTVIQRPQNVHRFPLSDEDAKLVDQIVDKNYQAASHYLSQLKNQFATKELKLNANIVIGDNAISPLHDMVEEAKADLVLLAAHGTSGERRWPYGSVASSFISYGNTPLLIMQDLASNEIQSTHAEMAIKEGKGH